MNNQYNQNYHNGVPVVSTTTHQTHVIPTTGNIAYTTGQAQKWHNPYNRSIPVIAFDPKCSKCHGSGVRLSTFSSKPLPCNKCYTRHGYCKKCFGSGLNFRKDKPCNKCEKGKRIKKATSKSSSSSSESEKGYAYK